MGLHYLLQKLQHSQLLFQDLFFLSIQIRVLVQVLEQQELYDLPLFAPHFLLQAL